MNSHTSFVFVAKNHYLVMISGPINVVGNQVDTQGT